MRNSKFSGVATFRAAWVIIYDYRAFSARLGIAADVLFFAQDAQCLAALLWILQKLRLIIWQKTLATWLTGWLADCFG